MPDHQRRPEGVSPAGAGGQWDLRDAETRFDEIVRHAQTDGPQHVTVQGHDGVVVLSEVDFRRLRLPSAQADLPLVDFMESLHVGDLDLTRDPDSGRETEL